MSDWLPIETAQKDGTRILVAIKKKIPREGRSDLGQWQGLQFVAQHQGLAPDGFDIGWSFGAPIGMGGFPDDWLAGWKPLEPHPED